MSGQTANGSVRPPQMELSHIFKLMEEGSELRRVKRRSLAPPRHVSISADHRSVCYHSRYAWQCVPSKLKSVDIGDIVEIRNGWTTDNFNKACRKADFPSLAPESNCFSVVFRHPHFFQKSVDLVAESAEIKEAWVSGLTNLIAARKKEIMQFNEDRWLVEQFKKADKDGNGVLTFPELWELFKRLNLEVSLEYGREMFDRADVVKTTIGPTGEAVLDDQEFLGLFRSLTARPELETVMRMYASNGENFLVAKDVQEFLIEEQGCNDIDLKKAESIIQMFEPDGPTKSDLLLGPIGFRKLLMSPWASIFKPEHEAVFQDMTLPLNNYYASASHNTYLTGLQLRGQATVEGYIHALKKGARLVELDIFDGDHGEPVITHKRTLITPISLRDALQAIDKYAFASSPYPVILTIENHVGLSQQRVMAKIFKSVFGNRLYIRPKDADVKPLPSPEELKEKFLLRGKKLPTQRHDQGLDRDPESLDDENVNIEKVDMADGNIISNPKIELDVEYSNLISLPSAKFENVGTAIKEHPLDGTPSLSESNVTHFFNSPEEPSIMAYTATRLIKSYPAGYRQDSSNMHPLESWLCGIQHVAMNMQTPGEEMDLVNGMFRVNGNCGYVLKPDVLRQGLDPRSSEVSGDVKLVLKINIISGQYLPKPESMKEIIDPYVSLQIYGLPCDSAKQRTKTIYNNGFNPVWRETFTFELRCPELALLRICVKDYDQMSSNSFIGQYTLPVNSIRSGYAHVKLHTGLGMVVGNGASLFVQTAVKVPQ
uniref:Phosphoinositide phospholipase C n=1 Tax=Plectus sambesii TaxID=2011161 RepID=A0A914V4X9_9BILA